MRKHMLLAEMFSLHTLLLENRVEFLKKNLLPKIEPKAPAMLNGAPAFIKTDLRRLRRCGCIICMYFMPPISTGSAE